MIKIHLALSTFGLTLMALPVYLLNMWLLVILGLLNLLYIVVMAFRMPSPGPAIERMYLWIIIFSLVLDVGAAYHKIALVWSGGGGMVFLLLLIGLEPLPKRFRKDRHGRTTTDQL